LIGWFDEKTGHEKSRATVFLNYAMDQKIQIWFKVVQNTLFQLFFFLPPNPTT
jgi:hypothetical protein